MGFLQHYYIKVSTHCVGPITHGPVYTQELAGIVVSAKAASEGFATLRGAQSGVAFSQHSDRVGHVRRAAVIATYKGLCGRRQPMNCCTFMIFTELCGDS